MFYTYAYLREDGTPYYVGKGQGRRCYERARHRIAVPQDRSRILFLKKNLTNEEAIKHEVYMIAILGRKDLNPKGLLRNLTDGGEGSTGWVMPDEQRAIVSRTHKGKTLPDWHLEKLRQANTGRGKSEEEKEKIRARLNKSLTLIHIETGEIRTFKSRKEAWTTLGCARGNIQRLLKNPQSSTKGWRLYNDEIT